MTKADSLKLYKVVFSDGTINRVYGCWAAHAWAVARELWPNKDISGLELIGLAQDDATVP